MCIAFWITKATNTHSQYVLLTAFPLQLVAWTHLIVMLYVLCLSCWKVLEVSTYNKCISFVSSSDILIETQSNFQGKEVNSDRNSIYFSTHIRLNWLWHKFSYNIFLSIEGMWCRSQQLTA
jgi:hypothetical protein